MANMLNRGKKTVDMAAPVVRVSRIRRDPPPPVKVVTVAEIKERDARNTVIGIIGFALAVFIVLMGISNVSGWSLSQYKLVIEEKS